MTGGRTMAAKRDYYDVLGISRSADKGTIKRAYRKLAKKYHPDTNAGNAQAEEKFKEAAEAYEVLRDPNRRAQYDQFGHAGVDPNYGAGAGGYGSYGGGIDIDDIFGSIFGGFGGFGGQRRGDQIAGLLLAVLDLADMAQPAGLKGLQHERVALLQRAIGANARGCLGQQPPVEVLVPVLQQLEPRGGEAYRFGLAHKHGHANAGFQLPKLVR